MKSEDSSHQPLLHIRHLSVVRGSATVLHDINLTIHHGEKWAVLGNSGSGKTTVAFALAGRLPYQGDIQWFLPPQNKQDHPVFLVEQQHRFKNISTEGELYYQQRYHSVDANDAMTAATLLENEDRTFTPQQKRWLKLLRLNPLLTRPLIQLSNGEQKRLQLAHALFAHPAILLLDNPFLGLDTDGRALLQTILHDICGEGIHLILLLSRGEIPSCITHIAELEQGRLIQAVPKNNYKQKRQQEPAGFIFDTGMVHRYGKREDTFTSAVKMTDVSVHYGTKVVLKNIQWEVKRGERWLLRGANGAGKSTLLSLITADHPQSYANEYMLFDRRRGSGESIWEIKQKIGFVSPELHLYLQATVTCEETIASGLFDALGVFRKPTAEEQERVEWWIDVLHLHNERSCFLNQLPLGRQRMILLARALIKNPPMLILDEPCQGLDEEQTTSFRRLTDEVCLSFGTTLMYVSHEESDIPSCITHELRLERGAVAKSGIWDHS